MEELRHSQDTATQASLRTPVIETLRRQFDAEESLKAAPAVLQSNIPALDSLLAGGIRPGRIVEWGLQPGRNGRRIPALFLRGEIPPAVWIYSSADAVVYAPAWGAFGIALSRLFFIESEKVFRELKPLFLEDTFKIIVIDAPRRCTKGDLSFAAAQARLNRQIIFLIRNHFLSIKRGNAFAQTRINCAQHQQGFYDVHCIKGKRCGRIRLPNFEGADV